MASSGVRFTGEQGRPPKGDYCDRCGWHRPGDLTLVMVKAGRLSAMDEVELQLCGKCRAMLNGKATR